MDQKKIEDSIMKRASELFSKELLPYFGIHDKVVALEPTESVTITLNRQNMDFNYLAETNVIHHFEFQSTDISEEDCRRFRTYEATLSMKTGKTIITHVIYSSSVSHPISEFPDGINVYKMDAISLQDKNADCILEQIIEKVESGTPLEREDIISLILLPIMGGKLEKAERIRTALILLNGTGINCLSKAENEQVQALIYAFAEKFLSGGELENIREVLHMTRLGQMLMEEGWQKGRQEGQEEGWRKGQQEGQQKGLEEGIRIFIEDNMEEGVNEGRILFKLQNKYNLDAEKAQEYFAKYGK